MRKINIWIDDIREAPEDFYWCQTYNTAINAISAYSLGNNEINIIDFDHDLGNKIFGQREFTGYDIAKHIVENQIPIGGFRVHSMNPVGAKNIRELLTHYGYQEV